MKQYMKMLILILIHLNFIKCSNVILKEVINEEILKNPDKCLKIILTNYFLQNTLYYVNNNNLSDNVTPSNTSPYIIFNTHNNNNNITNFLQNTSVNKILNYVLYIQTLEEFIEVLSKISEVPEWNPRGRFLIVMPSINNILNCFKIVYHYDMTQTIILLTKSMEMYKFNPFLENKYCKNKDTTLQKIKDCNTSHLYEFKIIKGCTFKVNVMDKLQSWPYVGPNFTTSPNPGIYIEVLKLLVDKLDLNVTYIVDSPELQYSILKGDITRLNNQLYNKTIDTFWSSLMTNPKEEYSKPFFIDPYLWIVSKPNTAESSVEALFSIFSSIVWLNILLALFLVATFYYIAHAWSSQKFIEKMQYSLLQIYNISLGNEIAITKKDKGVLKGIILMYFIYAMNINYAFQGRLISVLTHPHYDKGITTIEELLDSDIVPLVHEMFLPLFLSYNMTQAKQMHDRAITLSISGGAQRLQYIVKYRNVTSTILESVLQLYPKEKQQVNSLGTKFSSNVICQYKFRKGHPFLSVFDSIIDAVVTGGFVQKWLSDISVHSFKGEVQNKIVLTLHHLEAAYMLFSVGIFLSISVFFIERCFVL